MHGSTTTDYGIPALGIVLRLFPSATPMESPGNHSLLQNETRERRRLAYPRPAVGGAQPLSRDAHRLELSGHQLWVPLPDNQTLTRFSEDAAYPLRFYDWQTDLTGIFKTGNIEHNFLIGFEYGSQSVVQGGVFSDAPPINLL